MSTTTHAPVIVVTEEKKRRKGMIWLAGGAAVAVAAVGGGTFALWSDTAAFDGGTITAGDLDLRKVAETSFYDISPDRDDIQAVTADGVTLADATGHLNLSGDASVQDGALQGHLIDAIADWRIVPGDTVAAVVPAQIHLVGDNLVAELSVNPAEFVPGQSTAGDVALEDGADEAAGAEQADADGFTNMTYTYTVYGTDGAVLPGYDHVAIPTDGSFTGHLAYFDAATDGQTAGLPDAESGVIAVDATTGELNVTVVIEAAFQDTDDRVDVGAAEIIGDLKLSLTQLRAGSLGIDGTSGVGGQQTS